MQVNLHLGAGKVNMGECVNTSFNIFVDRSYDSGMCEDIRTCEEKMFKITTTYYGNGFLPAMSELNSFVAEDIFVFTESFKFKVNNIYASRIFEHLEYTSGQIGRLLEACNMITTSDASIEIVVPDARKLSHKLIELENRLINAEKINRVKDLNDILIINTEFTNSSHIDPHCSVWTPELARFYIEPEGTWKINKIIDSVKINGRDIYFGLVLVKA